jgi:zinc transport system substrate-binding protein
MRINRKKQLGKHAVISGIRMPQLRCTRVSESDILRRASLALCACLLFTAVFVGCGTEASDEPVDPNRLQVMASFYTMYDFAQKIGGEHVQVTCMVPSGTEPHDWEPSTKDITRMEQADVFIYNGAGMEHWVSDVLAGLSNKKLISVEASQGVSLLRSAEEEDGHDHEAAHADEDEEDSHDHDDADAEDAVHEEDAADRVVVAAPDGHDGHEHGEYDPHVWLDPMNVKQEMQNICEAFSEADPEHRADYQANYEKWAKQLDELDKIYQTTLENLSERNIVVAHEAYGYLCRRYNLTQVSIEGMSPDSEPDPGRMADIIDFVRTNNVRAIFFEELSGSRTAETVAAETGVKLLTLSPLEGLSDRQEETGGDYFSVMEENLQQLTEALR